MKGALSLIVASVDTLSKVLPLPDGVHGGLLIFLDSCTATVSSDGSLMGHERHNLIYMGIIFLAVSPGQRNLIRQNLFAQTFVGLNFSDCLVSLGLIPLAIPYL
jgi:hypothetical protein